MASVRWFWNRGEFAECGGLLASIQEGTAIRGINEMALVSKILAAEDPMEMEGCEYFSLVARTWFIAWTDKWDIINVFVEKVYEHRWELGRGRGLIGIDRLAVVVVLGNRNRILGSWWRRDVRGVVLDDCSHVHFGANEGVAEKSINQCVGLEDGVGEEDHHAVGGIVV